MPRIFLPQFAIIIVYAGPVSGGCPAPEHECDRLVAHPNSKNKIGNGVKWDDLEPVAAIRACNDAVSQFSNELRFIYQLGRAYSKKKDDTNAIKWYTRAAELGDAHAQYLLGRMYRKGEGVPQDYKTAFKWYKLSAEQGNVC